MEGTGEAYSVPQTSSCMVLRGQLRDGRGREERGREG